jgi:hypothetical protein
MHAQAINVHTVNRKAVRTHSAHVRTSQALVMQAHVMHAHAVYVKARTVHFMCELIATCQLHCSDQTGFLWIRSGMPG